MLRKLHFSVLIAACLLFSINIVSAQYCIPHPTYGGPVNYSMYIATVNLGDINVTDTYSSTDPTYSDYTIGYQGQTLLTRGKSYNLTITAGPTAYFASMRYAAWIDYNNDKDFTDTNEKLGEFTTSTLNQTFIIPFTVPSNVSISTSRIRVRCVYSYSNLDPCTNYDYGETEDYTVSISDFLKVDPGIAGTMGDIAFFNYDADADYDIILQDEISPTTAVKFYNNNAGIFTNFNYLNGNFPEPDNENLSFNLCDLNNDNQLDILFTYRYNSSFGRTLLYEKQGSLLNFVNSGFANLKRGSSSTADLNNDGRQDVVICGQDDAGVPRTYIYMNTPTGFVMVNDKLTGVYGQVLTADYDNDMDIDILLSGIDRYGNTNTIIYRNDNNWQFTNIFANLKKVGWLDRSEFGDFNNDGLLDLVVADKIYKNNGNDTFTEVYLEVDPWLTDVCHWNDIDNNGILELISQDDYGVVIFKYNGIDSFLIDQKLFVKGDNIGIGDYNKDNKQDIIVNNYPMIYILKNQTPGTNSAPTPPPSLKSSIGTLGYYSVTLSWKSGQDLLTPVKGLSYNLRVGTTPGGNDIVSSMSSIADNSLLKPGLGNVFSNTSWNLKDLKPGKYYWSVQTIDNSNLASPFSATQQFDILAPLTASVFAVDGSITNAGAGADFDGDKDIDLIIMDSVFAIYEQISPYNYLYHKVKSHSTILDIKDLNNDNLPDIIARHNHIISTESHDSLSIFINKGNFTFDIINLDTLSFNTVAAADFDNDGDIDILVHDYGYYLFENIGSLNFNRIKLPFTEILGMSSISAIDIDRDNDFDFIISGKDQSNGGECVTYVYKNSGKNTFTFSQKLSQGLGPYRFMPTAAIYINNPADITWNDYNFDGYPDLSITGGDTYLNNNNLIYINDGTGNLVLTNISPRPANKFSTSWIDFNTDGYLDLIMPKMGFSIDNTIYLNDKNNGYYAFPNSLDSLVTLMYIDAIDVDNDKDKDIVYTYKIPVGIDSYSTKTKIHTNNNNFVNKPPSPPATITNEIDSFTVKLGWSKGLDDLTNSEGLTYNIWVGTGSTIPNIISPLSHMQTGNRFVENIGNVGTNLSWTIENLPLGTYYWGVQTIDNSLQGSTWSAVKSFKISALTSAFNNDTVCLGFDSHLTDRSVSTNTIDSWHWDFGDGNLSSSQNPIFRFTKPGNNPVKLVVISGTSIDSITKNVYIKAIPYADFTSDIVCDGEPTSFTNLTILNGLTISEWHWSFGDGSGSAVENPGIHGYLVPGTYITRLISLANNGCSDTIIKSVLIGTIPAAAITSSGNPNFCSGDSIVLSNSYVNSYIYNWQISGVDITGADSNVYVARQSGSYTIKVINPIGSCQTISSQVSVNKLTVPATPLIVTENYLEGKCPGDNQVILSVDQSVADYSYQWKRNGTPISNATTSSYQGQGILPAGDYTVVVSQEGCKTESVVKTITYDDSPEKPLIYAQGPTVWYLACNNLSAKNYRWYYNGTLIPGADKYMYVANQKLGKYNVSISNAKDCFTMSDTITIPKGITGIEDVDPFMGLVVYPNPSSGIFTIEMDNQLFGELKIRISDQNGKHILNIKSKKTTGHFSTEVDLGMQPKGFYFISLYINGKISNKKIIIE